MGTLMEKKHTQHIPTYTYPLWTAIKILLAL